jgi:hypothetical protein
LEMMSSTASLTSLIFLTKAAWSFTSKLMWSRTRPRVGACAV